MRQDSPRHIDEIDYQALFMAAPGAYLILDPTFTIVAVNQAYLQATMRQREDLIGAHIFDAFPDNPLDPSADGVHNLRASLELVLHTYRADVMAVQKYDIPRPDAVGGGFEERYWSPINTPVLNDHGAVVWIIHRVEDVTAYIHLRQQQEMQGQAEQTLRAKAAQMEMEIYVRERELQEKQQQNQQMDDFLNIASHELRTPLTSIMGYVQLAARRLDAILESGDLNQLMRLQPLLDHSNRQAHRLARLINALLDVSRIQAGKLALQKQTCDLVPLVRDILEEHEMINPHRHISFRSDRETLLLDVDADRIGQVVANYLTNALKYATGDICVSVSVAPRQTQALVEVRDAGPGVSPQEQTHIFERFYRVQGVEAQSGSEVGLGLGLFICKTIIEQHGGRVGVKSLPHEGATFWFTLPLNLALPATIAS